MQSTIVFIHVLDETFFMKCLNVQESFSVLAKYGVSLTRDESDRVDTLRLSWVTVQNRSMETQNHLSLIQPQFR